MSPDPMGNYVLHIVLCSRQFCCTHKYSVLYYYEVFETNSLY